MKLLETCSQESLRGFLSTWRAGITPEDLVARVALLHQLLAYFVLLGRTCQPITVTRQIRWLAPSRTAGRGSRRLG